MLEQGLHFTIIEAAHPLDDDSPAAIAAYDAHKNFYSARRVWLGWAWGTDWLHDALERELGDDAFWYEVQSGRRAHHVGAAAEVSTVVLILMGVAAIEFARKFGSRLGERSADDLFDWVKKLAKQRREEKGIAWDDIPDFSTYGGGTVSLPEAIKGELADVMGVPADQLELVSTEGRSELVLFARYRDEGSGREYTAEVGRSDVLFRRVGAPAPEIEE